MIVDLKELIFHSGRYNTCAFWHAPNMESKNSYQNILEVKEQKKKKKPTGIAIKNIFLDSVSKTRNLPTCRKFSTSYVSFSMWCGARNMVIHSPQAH